MEPWYSEVIQVARWDSSGFFHPEKRLNVYLDESPLNPREEYDTIADFQQLESDSIALDDIYLAEALCAAGIRSCGSGIDCSGDHAQWDIRWGQYYLEKILARHIKLYHPEIIWHGQLCRNGYSQGDVVNVYAVVTKQAMQEMGIADSHMTSERAEEIAKAEFDEYASWALGDCYVAEYDGEFVSGLNGSDFDKVIKHIYEHFI